MYKIKTEYGRGNNKYNICPPSIYVQQERESEISRIIERNESATSRDKKQVTAKGKEGKGKREMKSNRQRNRKGQRKSKTHKWKRNRKRNINKKGHIKINRKRNIKRNTKKYTAKGK